MARGKSDKKLSRRRLVENEVIFREVNKTVKEFLGDIKDDPSEREVPFYCECANPECVDRIELTPAEYEELHSDKRRFVTKIGHEFTDVETVIKQENDYQIVEKHLQPPKPSDISKALKSIKI